MTNIELYAQVRDAIQTLNALKSLLDGIKELHLINMTLDLHVVLDLPDSYALGT